MGHKCSVSCMGGERKEGGWEEMWNAHVMKPFIAVISLGINSKTNKMLFPIFEQMFVALSKIEKGNKICK